MAPKIIYITGFRQHAGKTVTSLGLLSLLKKKFDPEDLGYIKPVGQELVLLPDGRKIDKDATIVEKFAGIPDLDLNYVSPVRLGRGFTKDFLDSSDPEQESRKLSGTISTALETMSKKKVIVAEGTGHPGVGGIVGLSNAMVSNLIGADTVFLSGGGIGKALDQLEVDLSYFIYKKSNVRGVIVNKIIPEKMDTVKKYLSESLLTRMYPQFQNPLRVFGYLPSIADLNMPSMVVIRRRFRGHEVISNPMEEKWQIPISNVRVISLPDEYLNLAKYLDPQTVVIMGAGSKNRLERIVEYNKARASHQKLGGIILTCGDTIDLLEESRITLKDSGIPSIYVNEDTAQSEDILQNCMVNTKIQTFDTHKFQEIQSLFEQHFDFKKFTTCLGI